MKLSKLLRKNTQNTLTPNSHSNKFQKLKKTDKISFEFIKNLDISKIDEIYSDLPIKEITKLVNLHHIANMSENEILNKTLYNQAKKLLPKKVGNFYLQKASEQYHYKIATLKQKPVTNNEVFVKDINGRYTISNGLKNDPSTYKLTHEEAYNMILDMIGSSKEGMKKAIDEEMEEQYKNVFDEYTTILDNYTKQLKML